MKIDSKLSKRKSIITRESNLLRLMNSMNSEPSDDVVRKYYLQLRIINQLFDKYKEMYPNDNEFVDRKTKVIEPKPFIPDLELMGLKKRDEDDDHSSVESSKSDDVILNDHRYET